MIKKSKDFEEEEIDNEFIEQEVVEEDDQDLEDDDLNIDSDDDDIDIIIEIDDDDLDIMDEEVEKVEETTQDEDIILSKHKLEGKHSLKYDSIFKGKKEEITEDDEYETQSFQKDMIEVDKSSNYYFESVDNEKYTRSKLVKEMVYSVLKDNTTINFLNNRRKPSKLDFNHYYNLLKLKLKNESFTNIELFNELSVYFSDNLFNMFKLLDKKWRNLIIDELEEHIGSTVNSKEITNRNIYEGTEIEFEWYDKFNDDYILITGVVIEVNYEESSFRVDSFENIYEVGIDIITKILNNTKFKYNLNKLNNIDFL